MHVVRVARDVPIPHLDDRLPTEPADPDALVALSDRHRLDGPLNRLLAALSQVGTSPERALAARDTSRPAWVLPPKEPRPAVDLHGRRSGIPPGRSLVPYTRVNGIAHRCALRRTGDICGLTERNEPARNVRRSTPRRRDATPATAARAVTATWPFATSATWSRRSMSWRVQRTKSPAVSSSSRTPSSCHPAGPLVGRPGEPRVGLAQEVEPVLGLRGVEPAPQPHHPGQRGADRSRHARQRRLARRAGDPVAAGFVDQCGHGSGQLGSRQLIPDALAQALDHEQVGFAVDPGQLPSGGVTRSPAR